MVSIAFACRMEGVAGPSAVMQPYSGRVPCYGGQTGDSFGQLSGILLLFTHPCGAPSPESFQTSGLANTCPLERPLGADHPYNDTVTSVPTALHP